MTISKEGTTAYLKVGFHAPAGARRRFLPAARARRGADRCEGRQPVGEFPNAAAAAKRAAVSRARQQRPGVGGERRLVPTQEPFLYTHLGDGDGGTSLARSREAARWRRSMRVAARRHHARTSCRRPRTSCAPGWCSRTTASRTSRTSSGIFETIASWQLYPTISQRIEAVTIPEVNKVAADRLRPTSRTVGRFEPIQ